VLKSEPARRWALVRYDYPCECLTPEGTCSDYEGRPHTCRLYKCDKLRNK
jgi:hypothetical protein